jgi:hypothetical protein
MDKIRHLQYTLFFASDVLIICRVPRLISYGALIVLMAVNPDLIMSMLGQHGNVSLLLCVRCTESCYLPSSFSYHICILLQTCRSCLQIALEDLTSLETVLSLKSNPAVDCTSLDTNHLLVAVLGLEVGNGFGAFSPRVPDDGVLHVVSDDIQARLIVDKD